LAAHRYLHAIIPAEGRADALPHRCTMGAVLVPAGPSVAS
jgi:hypothetical protein